MTRRQLRRSIGVCIDCGDDSAGGVYCDEHRKRRNGLRNQRNAVRREIVRKNNLEAVRRMREARRKAGLCECKRPTPFYRCLRCRLRHNEQKREAWADKRVLRFMGPAELARIRRDSQAAA